MAWKLDDNKPVYIQLIEEIKHRILTGEYKTGSRLPSVRELALDASVNPNTMQRALSDLEREGLIFAERTTGRFVTEDMAMVNNLKDGFAQDIIDNFIKNLKELGFSKQEILTAISSAVEL